MVWNLISPYISILSFKWHMSYSATKNSLHFPKKNVNTVKAWKEYAFFFLSAFRSLLIESKSWNEIQKAFGKKKEKTFL